MGIKLVLFDLDGTLLDTNHVDGACFQQAAQEVIGIEKVDTNWGAYQESTDPAIFRELFEKNMGRAPSVGEVGNFRRHFVSLLKKKHSEKASLFSARPGSLKMFEALDKLGWKAGIATGAWKDSAEFKLEAGNFPFDHLVAIATADDSDQRSLIIDRGRKIAEEMSGKVERTVYVGDGLWDLKAAATLKIPFLGVGGNAPQETEFKKRGIAVTSNFEDVPSLEKLLVSANIATWS